MRTACTALVAAALLAGCGSTESTEDQDDISPVPARAGGAISVPLRTTDGASAGSVELLEQRGVLEISARVSGLEPGLHPFELRSTADCKDDGGEAVRDGELPDLLAGDDGVATLSFTDDRATLADLRDADGSAVVISPRDDAGGEKVCGSIRAG